jgi:hypothetical protein
MLLSGVCGEVERRRAANEHPGRPVDLGTTCHPCEIGGCSAGKPTDGGVALEGNGTCRQWCTVAGFCGKTRAYAHAGGSTDCRHYPL